MKLSSGRFKLSDLEFVARAPDISREPPFMIGNFIMLNSGGPVMMIVDRDDEHVIASWRDQSTGKVCEHCFLVSCVHRVWAK